MAILRAIISEGIDVKNMPPILFSFIESYYRNG